MTDSSRVTLFILTRDRSGYFEETLQSALAQSRQHDVRIVVSDNSVGDDTEQLMLSHYPQVSYVRRRPPLEALDHFRAVAEAVDTEYFVLFHDDDVLHPDFVERTVSALDADPALAAIGTNAWILKGDKLSNRTFMGYVNRPRRITNVNALIKAYFGIGGARPAPFPAYMYRHTAVEGLYLDAHDGGKYSDVSFLIKVLDRGPILWCADPLVQYRIHGSNDSRTVDLGQQLKLLRFARHRSARSLDAALMREVRFVLYWRWLIAKRRARSRTPRQTRLIVAHMLNNLPIRAIAKGLHMRISARVRGLHMGIAR